MTLVAFFLALAFQAVVALTSGTAPLGCTSHLNDNDSVGYHSFYYAPSDGEDWGAHFTASLKDSDTCPSGQYIAVSLQLSNGNSVQCSNLVVDSQTHLIQCPGAQKGSLPAGKMYYVYAWSDETAYYPFTVVHTQVTATASTPTTTVVGTSTQTSTTVTTITYTDTYTTAQSTVTSPSSSTTNTITVIPPSTSTTVTSTQTLVGITFKGTTVVHTTVTSPMPCGTATTLPLPAVTKRRAKSVPRRPAREMTPKKLERRYANSGDGPAGDGPLTVTSTPDPVIVPSTTTTTSTLTMTSIATPNASTTVPNPTPTTTIYSGVAVYSTTTTLPTVTITRTKYAYALVAITTSQATVRVTSTAYTKPVTC